MATPSLKPTKVPGCVIVTIGLDANGKVTCDPDEFRVSKGKNPLKTIVLWHCTTHNNFSVDFDKNGSPFHDSHFDQKNPWSGFVRRDVEPNGTLYKYTVTIGEKSLDPGGRVDP